MVSHQSDQGKPGSNGRPLTLVALAEHKCIPVDFLRDLGLEDLSNGGVAIPYYGPTGEEVAIKRRTSLAAREGSFWPKGQPLTAYGQWRLDYATKVGFLILVEGESDCWALWLHELPALGLPGSSTARTLLSEHVEGVPTIYIHREPDQGGEQFVAGVAARLRQINFRGRAYELRLADDAKDPADLHSERPDQFTERFEAAIAAAVPLAFVTSSSNGSGASGPDPEGLAVTCLSTISPEPVRWLVPDYLPLGKLVLIAGDGGHGKSTLTLHLTACLTQGFPCFGLDYDPLPQAEVLLISCEDDFGDTVVPRLLSAGADLGRVFRVDGVKGKDGKPLPFSLAHYQALEQELEDRPGVRLVVIDPAGAYIGNAGIDDHKDSELRSLLGPLCELAARRRVTILLVKHVNRNTGAKAVHRVMGSAGYNNTVRASLLVAPDPDEEDRKLFLPLKCNLGPRPSGLAYRLQALDAADQERILAPFTHLGPDDRERLAGQLFRTEWLGTVTTDADAALAGAAKQGRGPGKVDQAAEWLERFLAEYAYPSDEVLAAGEEAGFTRNNLFGAKKKLGIKASNRGRFGGAWHWGAGDPQRWTVRPSPHPSDTTDTMPAHSVHSDHSVESVGEPVFDSEVL